MIIIDNNNNNRSPRGQRWRPTRRGSQSITNSKCSEKDSVFGLGFQWLPSPTPAAVQWNGLCSSLRFPPFWLLLLTLPPPRVVCQVVIESTFNRSYMKSHWIMTRLQMDTLSRSPTSAVVQGKECVLLWTSHHFGFNLLLAPPHLWACQLDS